MLLFVAAALASPVLEVDGACPGPVSLTAEVTPGALVAVLVGTPGDGRAAGPCAGTPVGVVDARVHTRTDGDGDGRIRVDFESREGLCGATAQVVDATTCAVSEPRTLPAPEGPGCVTGPWCADDGACVLRGALDFAEGCAVELDRELVVASSARLTGHVDLSAPAILVQRGATIDADAVTLVSDGALVSGGDLDASTVTLFGEDVRLTGGAVVADTVRVDGGAVRAARDARITAEVVQISALDVELAATLSGADLDLWGNTVVSTGDVVLDWPGTDLSVSFSGELDTWVGGTITYANVLDAPAPGASAGTIHASAAGAVRFDADVRVVPTAAVDGPGLTLDGFDVGIGGRVDLTPEVAGDVAGGDVHVYAWSVDVAPDAVLESRSHHDLAGRAPTVELIAATIVSSAGEVVLDGTGAAASDGALYALGCEVRIDGPVSASGGTGGTVDLLASTMLRVSAPITASEAVTVVYTPTVLALDAPIRPDPVVLPDVLYCPYESYL